MEALRILLLAAAAIASAHAACSGLTGNFERYMTCIKDKVSPQFQSLERSYHDDMVDIADKAFGGPSARQCSLSEKELTTDVFGPDSIPLADCTTCKLIAKVAVQLVNSVDQQTANCASKIIRDRIAGQMAECVRAKTGFSFSTPNVPDFDEDGFRHRDLVKESLSRCINIQARLQLCESKNAAGYGGTSRALAQWLAGGGFEQTCKLAEGCNGGSCASDVNTAHKAACECLTEGSDKIKEEVEKLGNRLVSLIFAGKNCTLFASRLGASERASCGKVAQDIQSMLQSHASEPQPDGCSGAHQISGLKYPNMKCACYWSVREALRAQPKYSSKPTDWYLVVKEVKDTCLGDKDVGEGVASIGGGGKLTLDKAIFWGCDRILKQDSMRALIKATTEMWTGASFLGNLVDCSVQRVGRYCPCN